MRKLPLIFLLILCASCSPSEPPSDGRLNVIASILPQKYFIDQIGGENVNVTVLVPPGKDPHTFEPSPQQMTAVARAKILFIAGMPFEKRLRQKLSGGTFKIFDTSEGIPRRIMTEEEIAAEHDEHDDGDDDDIDPHSWLAPQYARIHAANIANALIDADPASAEEYRANLDALDKKLIALDTRLREALEPIKGRAFYVYHPAFGYFADAYGLKQVAVETGGREPGPRQLAALVAQAKREGVKVIFVQPQFSPRAAKTIAGQIGGVVVPMDDLAYDYISNLEDMAAKVKQALHSPQEAK